MDLCQVGLATGADVDDVLCDGAIPIKGSHPGQHLTPLRVVGDGDIEWSIRHLCVQGRGRGTIKEHWNVWQAVLMEDQRWQSHLVLAGTHRRRWKEYKW